MNAALSDIAVLRRRLEEAEAERTRLSQHIRHLRAVVRAIETGAPVPPAEDFRSPPHLREVPAPFSPVADTVVAPFPAAVPNVDVGALRTLSPEALDALPYGVITLDATGRVVGYNDTESRLAALPKDKVLGRNFFAEVAPCTRVRDFEGRFRDFAEGRTRAAVETFEFVFHFRHGVQRVVILVTTGRRRGEFFVSLLRR